MTMTNINDHFSVEDDDILASVLEESLRHYNEVEVALRSIEVNAIGVPGPSKIEKHVSSSIEVVDLCDSPKKCLPVQSRLSHFFKKPLSDNFSNIETKNDLEKKIDQFSVEKSSLSVHNDINISSSPAIFYKEPDAEGFHLSSGTHYVYPSNFPVREYQMEIIKTALFHNTLVSLPTGLGKTFIAAVVMYNFYRWYPMSKIVFMAPTRPLVAQQIEACHSIMGISKEMTFEMTGNIPPEQRYLAWKKYRVFFLTPQVLANDLNLNKCPSEMIRCIIVDEAHRATKDYAYVQVLKRLHEENRIIRIVGLSATPGTTVEAVTEVIHNLNISKLEFRTEESPDVAKHINKKDVECISVKLTNAILTIRAQFLGIYDKYSRRLKQYHVLSGNITNLSKFQILGAKQRFLTSNLACEMPKSIVGCLINDFTVCMSLAYALELLIVYGVKVFYLQLLEIMENYKSLSDDVDLQKMLRDISKELNSQDLTWSHPKLIELKTTVQKYFNSENTESNSKIIIFCQYRLVVVEVFELLKTFGPSVKPVMFVGQSSKEKGGLTQKKQLEVMRRFISGVFNVLIATSVAEEGLDIGEVDLIICLEANKSPIKFVQRIGRTGRKRSGKCITLLTEGKEQMKYKSSVSSSKTLVIKMLKNNSILSKLSQGGPRLIPKHLNPQCLMIHVKKPEVLLPEKKKLKGKRKAEENIMQYKERNDGQNEEEKKEEEEELDVFQNNKDKPKRRSKKQKSAGIRRNENCRESPIENNIDLNYIHNSIDNDFNIPKNNAFAVTVKNVDNQDYDLDYFVDENKAFNKWVQSCEPTNSLMMNSLFFNLLDLFTDHSVVNNSCDTTPLMYDVKGKLNNCCIIKPEDSKDLFKSQNVDNNTKTCNEETAFGKLNFGSLVHSANRQTCPIVCSDRNNRKTVKSDEDECAGKINFNMLIKSQRTDGYIEDYMERTVGSHEQQPSDNVDREISRWDVAEINRVMHFDNEGSPSTVKRVEYDDGEDKDSPADVKSVVCNDEDEDDLAIESFDVEDLFKSQRANAYIKEYTDKIVAIEQLNVDSDESFDSNIIKQKSPIICNGRNKTATVDSNSGFNNRTVNMDSCELFMGKPSSGYMKDLTEHITVAPKDNDFVTTIDLIKNDEEGKGDIDSGNTLNNQRVDTENNVDKNMVSPRENITSIDGVTGDDDVISISDSPEFFSCKLPQKKVQTRLTDCIRKSNQTAATIQVEELSSTSCSPDLVVGLQKDNNKLTTGIVVAEGQSNINEATTKESDGFSGLPSFEDDDDMDFMFVDYCGDWNSNTNVLTQKKVDSSNFNVFTQKEQVKDSSFNVFTQKERVEDTSSNVFTQKERVNDVCSNVFTQKERVNDVSSNVFTQKEQVKDNTSNVFMQNETFGGSLRTDVFTQKCQAPENRTLVTQQWSKSCSAATLPQHRLDGKILTATDGDVKSVSSKTSMKPSQNSRVSETILPVPAHDFDPAFVPVPAPITVSTPAPAIASVPQSFNNGMVPFNIMKACNLLPGFSLKRNTTLTSFKRQQQQQHLMTKPSPPAVLPSVVMRSTTEDMSPIPPPGRRRRPQFSQSTPKLMGVAMTKQPRENVNPAETVNLLTSSSSSDPDVFVEKRDDEKTRRRRLRKKRRSKPKKKLLFIDDEADVTNCGNASIAATVSSSSSDDDDDNDDFDSSFIDDEVEESKPSTSMTKQYLQSVKSPANVRGVFKIPKLSRQHYNIDVYSQMDDRNDNSYEEDSFCVRDTSDLNTSSNTSAQQTSDERPSRAQKRKRILSPESTDSDSPDQFKTNTMRKRAKVRTSLDFSQV